MKIEEYKIEEMARSINRYIADQVEGLNFTSDMKAKALDFIVTTTVAIFVSNCIEKGHEEAYLSNFTEAVMRMLSNQGSKPYIN